MGVYALKPRFQRALHGVEGWLVARGVHPDTLTLGAVGLAVVGGALLFAAAWTPALLLLVPFLALGRTVLNAGGDRLADVALLGGLALAPTSDGRLGAAALVVVLLSSLLGIASQAAG